MTRDETVVSMNDAMCNLMDDDLRTYDFCRRVCVFGLIDKQGWKLLDSWKKLKL